MIRVGLISDTHGLLRPDAAAFLQGSDCIVHAGDICDPAVLERLAAIAPVTAVRGNNDRGAWAERLNETEFVQAGAISVYAIHDLAASTSSRVPPACASSSAVIRTGRWSRSATACSTSTRAAQGRAASGCRSRSAN
jgi:putative phosphoesterase